MAIQSLGTAPNTSIHNFNGSTLAFAPTLPFNLVIPNTPPVSHTVTIQYVPAPNPVNNVLNVYLDNASTPILSAKVNLTSLLALNSGKAWVGFTAATALSWEDVRITNWNFRALDTIGAYNPTTSTFYLRNSNTTGSADTQVVYGVPGEKPVTGDWIGQGIDTLGVYDAAHVEFLLRNSNTYGYADTTFYFGGDPTALPLAGRWASTATHDGVGVYYPSNGTIYLKNEFTSGFADYSVILGLGGDVPIASDWNGVSVDGVGVYRPKYTTNSPNIQPSAANANFILRYQPCSGCPGTNYNFSQSYSSGAPQQTLGVAGVWTGTGNPAGASGGVGIYDPATSNFSLKNALSSGSGDTTLNFGNTGDIPLVGHWGSAPVTVTVQGTTYFRIAPALDDQSSTDPNGENWLFTIDSASNVIFPSSARPWLWAFNPVANGHVPSSVTIKTIAATGNIGIIPWVDKYTQWEQVKIDATLNNNGAMSTYLYGYLELTDKNNTPLATVKQPCGSALPFSPPDQPVPPTVAPQMIPSPVVTLASTFFVPPPIATAAPFGVDVANTANDLNNGLSSSVMGTFMFHNGNLEGGGTTSCQYNQQNCTGLTLDLVPQNQEFCIDNRSANNLFQCDPNPQDVITPTPIAGNNSSPRIPVYASLAGCALYKDFSLTIEVNQICSARQTPRLQIYLTHVTNPIAGSATNGVQVNAGDKVAELCTRQDWKNGQCGLAGTYQSDAPIHVAFQLRVYISGTNNFYWPAPPAYLLFLAHPSCLYDRWAGNNAGTPTPQPNPITQACP